MPSPTATKNLIDREVKQLLAEADYRDRIVLRDNFQTGRPILAASLDPSTINQASVRLLTGANEQWIISGTNAANAGSALAVDGGIALATAGADNDQIVLTPATAINSVGQSAFRATELEPEHQPTFEAIIELPSLADVQVQAGFVLTDAQDAGTDADQVKFQFSDEGSTSTTNLTRLLSIGGTDTEIDLGVAPTASRSLRLGIEIDGSRRAQMYVDGLKVGARSAAMTAGVNLIPMIGIQALTAAAKTVFVRELLVTRLKTAYAN